MENKESENLFLNVDFPSTKNYNSFILDILGEKPIAFNRIFAELVNSATGGLFMSQMLFWQGKGDDKEWIYKTINQMKEETALSKSEQNRAIRDWGKLGVLEKKVKGIPATRYFKINKEKLAYLIKQYIKNKQPNNQFCEEIRNKIAKYGE